MRGVQLVDPKSLDDFLKTGEAISRQFIDGDGDLLPTLREYHDFLGAELWSSAKARRFFYSPYRGHFYRIAAVRLALTGQFTGVFPLLRTGLEAFCYPARMTADPRLEAIWRARDANPEAAKACRREFESVHL